MSNKVEETAFREHIQLIQRMVQRVSAATNHEGKVLEDKLDSLRSEIHSKGFSIDDISGYLQEIESSVLKIDESRNEFGSKLLNHMEHLIDQLGRLDITQSQQEALDSLSKQIEASQQKIKDPVDDAPNNENRGVSTLISEPQPLESTPPEPTPAAPSPAPRVPANKPIQSAEQPSSRAPSSAPKVQSRLGGNLQPTMGRLGKASTPALGQAGDKPNSGKSEGFNLSNASPKEAPTASPLMQLKTKQNDTSEADKADSKEQAPALATPSRTMNASDLRSDKQEGLNWREIGEVIDELVEPRLEAIEGFLDSAFLQYFDRQGADLNLQNVIRSQIETISNQVDNAKEVEHLKETIHGNLDGILVTLSKFMLEEEDREKKLHQELSSARDRLNRLESELETVRQKLNEERVKALTDTLTKLPNREAYNERFSLEFKRWQRYGHPVVMVVADIDFFKKVNDTYGHLAGDRVIKVIAQQLKKTFRKTDFIARIGGEEFLIIMPETTLEIGHSILEQTRQDIEKLPFHFNNKEVNVTMSFGMTCFTPGMDKDKIFKVADEALYEAKEGGRNRVVIAKPDEPNA